MQSGKLDRRITIQAYTLSIPDEDTQEQIETWAAIENGTNVSASFVNKRGSEMFEADRNNQQVEGCFTIRFRSDLNERMRISYGGRYYYVYRLCEVGRRKWTEIYVTASPPDDQ